MKAALFIFGFLLGLAALGAYKPSFPAACSNGSTIQWSTTTNTWSCVDPVTFIPSGLTMAITSGSCPSGFTEVAALDGQMPIGTLLANSNVGTTGGSSSITPAGTVSAPTFTGSSGTVPAETISWPAGVPTAANESAHTHGVGSFAAAAQVFTGSALGTHTHTFTGNAVNAASTASTPDLVTSNTAGSGVSPTTTATGTNASVSAGTPVGTNASSAVSGASGAGSAHTHTVSWPAGVPINSTAAFTPVGTNSAPTLTGASFDPHPNFTRVIFCKKN